MERFTLIRANVCGRKLCKILTSNILHLGYFLKNISFFNYQVLQFLGGFVKNLK